MTAAVADPVARPAAFVDAMVRAIIEGRKTMTRRLMKPQPLTCSHYLQSMWGTSPDGVAFGTPYLWREVGPDYPDDESDDRRCPYGAPGDLIWVREGWRTGVALDEHNATTIAKRAQDAGWAKPWAPIIYADGATYDADTLPSFGGAWGRYRAARFMPRWASRILLRVTSVRVERLQEISEDDARAEGVDPRESGPLAMTARQRFTALWNEINGKRAPWSLNPWVFVIGFEQGEEGVRRAVAG